MRIYGGLKTLASFGNPDKCAQEGRLGMYARLQFQSVAYSWKGEVILGRTANGGVNEIHKCV